MRPHAAGACGCRPSRHRHRCGNWRVAQEFVDQIAIGGMDLYAIEAGGERVFGRPRIAVEQAGNFRDVERARGLEGLATIISMHLAGRRGRRRRHRLFSGHRGMHLPAHMPDLRDDTAAGVMHRLRCRLPCGDLRVAPQARRERPAKALLADPGSLADDQAGRGALGIILRHQWGRDMLAGRAAARQRRHQNAVWRGDRAQLDRIEETRHGIKFPFAT